MSCAPPKGQNFLNSSNISSGQKQPPINEVASRKSFALEGPSVAIDPRTQAVRPDLADIRLSDRVFAPHYAAPMTMVVQQPTTLYVTGASNAEMLAELPAGTIFEALDFAGKSAWGIAVALGLVGYVDRHAIAPAQD